MKLVSKNSMIIVMCVASEMQCGDFSPCSSSSGVDFFLTLAIVAKMKNPSS